MHNLIKIITITSTLITGVSHAQQWGNAPWGSNMMPFGGQSFQPQYKQPSYGSMMPWGNNSAPRYQAPQSNGFGGMMPWGGSQPQFQQPQSNGFGGMMPWGGSQPQFQQPQSNGFGGMMPWGGSQPQFQQPQSQNFMMPGMEQGFRGMMQPGKIMAEEATPGMYMKPTWR